MANLTNAGLNRLAQLMLTDVTWVAIGTGSTAPAAGDTQLVNEVFRLPVTSAVAGASPGEVVITASLAPGQAPSVAIAEAGAFGGTANSSANTGTLYMRTLYSHTHGSEVINLIFDCSL